MPKKKTGVVFLLITLALILIMSCESEGPAERAGEQIDRAAENIGEKTEEAGEAVREGVEETGEAIRGEPEKG